MTPEREDELFERLARIEALFEGIPKRLARVETWQHWVTGGFVAIGTAFTFTLDKFIAWIKP